MGKTDSREQVNITLVRMSAMKGRTERETQLGMSRNGACGLLFFNHKNFWMSASMLMGGVSSEKQLGKWTQEEEEKEKGSRLDVRTLRKFLPNRCIFSEK